MSDPTEDVIEAAYARDVGDWNYEHARYPRPDWQQEAGDGDTQLGYFDWVIHQIESEDK